MSTIPSENVRAATVGVFLCSLLTACSTTIPQGYKSGENLRLPAEILQWPSQTREELYNPGRPPGTEWQVVRPPVEDGHGAELSIWSVKNRQQVFEVLTAHEGPGPSLEDSVRMQAAQAAKSSCLTGTFERLGSSSTGGFSRALLLTTCSNGPEYSNDGRMMLFLQGRDAHYVLLRIWRLQPSAAEIRMWKDYFDHVAICDTRWWRSPRCPLENTVAP